jgi:hypothetical protein
MSDHATHDGPIPFVQFMLRLFWVVIQILFVYWLGASGAQFFYQGF